MLFNFIRRSRTSARPYIKLQLCCHGLPSHQFTTKSSNRHPFTVTYLINSCGVPLKSAILAPKRLDLSKSPSLDLSKSPNTADSVLAFLNNQGFTKSQISKLISKHPTFLLSDPENTLLPNFQILKSAGFSKPNLTKLVTAIPSFIVSKKFQETAPPCVDFLKTVLQSDDKVINAITHFPSVLTYNIQLYGAENIRILLDAGVSYSAIRAVLEWQPRTFLTPADRFRKVVKDVLDMGFDPSKTRFLWAIHAIRAMSKSTWDRKVEVYMKWGWSKDEIFIAFEKYPWCMAASTDKITRVLDFLVNTMGWKPSYIAQWPIVTCFSLEKRITPRCLVYQYLWEKGVIEGNEYFCFRKWLMCSDTMFLKWVVKRYEEEASEILKVYRKHMKQVHTIRAVSKSTWDTKVEVYMKWGWSKDEIFFAFEKCRGCMMASTNKITRILDFLVNTMGWKPSDIVKWPIIMSFSLEKRIIPRCLVYQYLGEKGVIEDFIFTKWLMYSDTKFLTWVLKRYEDEASEILKLYQKHMKQAKM